MIDEWGKGAKYWDYAWNPVIGCRKVSEGCTNCYAEALARRFPWMLDENGNFTPMEMTLRKPPKHGVVFCGNMTDIFGEWNSHPEIVKWLFMLSKEAQNLVLTKRPKRVHGGFFGQPYIHIGITAENQRRYDERIAEFRYIFQAGIPWLSAEPLLGPIDMGLTYIAPEDMPFRWVVVGAESGPNRRPCKLEWARLIVRQCQAAGVPVFVKQLDLDGKLEKDIAKFPDDLQIRQVPWKKDK